tara:strand:- start:889 stop:1731 length:843 start_codon:yes stop_codon:yes gene_type:complete
MHDNERLKGVMICGAGHSGSTLLGMILNGLQGAFYMGEGGKVRYLHDEKKPLRKRVCKICGEGCEVWSKFHWDRDQPLYPQIAAHTGARIVVDSTKDQSWITQRTDELLSVNAEPYLLFLTRDGRAVINSRLRKYPDRDPQAQMEDWMGQITRSEALFHQFPGAKLRLRYEELASEPERVARALCDFLGEDFTPDMLDFHTTPQHPLGGNSGTQYVAARGQLEDPEDAFVTLTDRTREYYQDHPDAITLDLRWKQELSDAHAALFEKIAGDFNQPLKWGE